MVKQGRRFDAVLGTVRLELLTEANIPGFSTINNFSRKREEVNSLNAQLKQANQKNNPTLVQDIKEQLVASRQELSELQEKLDPQAVSKYTQLEGLF